MLSSLLQKRDKITTPSQQGTTIQGTTITRGETIITSADPYCYFTTTTTTTNGLSLRMKLNGGKGLVEETVGVWKEERG